jgi:hypothetical protein
LSAIFVSQKLPFALAVGCRDLGLPALQRSWRQNAALLRRQLQARLAFSPKSELSCAGLQESTPSSVASACVFRRPSIASTSASMVGTDAVMPVVVATAPSIT